MTNQSKTILVIVVIGVLIYLALSSGGPEGESQKTTIQPQESQEYTLPREITQEAQETSVQQNCHPSYSGCLNPNASDYDCAGGSGNGPYYTGLVRVIGPDVFGLDRDGDGWGCE